MHKIFSYVVKYDTGVAPNVDGDVCTMCLCKPRIRLAAEIGDWIVGLWPAPDRFRVTYVMRVGQKLTMRRYYECGKFDQKKPGLSSTPDNIYEFHQLLGSRRREDTWVHQQPDHAKRDLGGRYALIANCFWYFGGTPYELPERFWKLDLPNPRRNHKVTNLNDAEMRHLIKWLNLHGQGVIGTPRDSHRVPRGNDNGRARLVRCVTRCETSSREHRGRIGTLSTPGCGHAERRG